MGYRLVFLIGLILCLVSCSKVEFSLKNFSVLSSSSKYIRANGVTGGLDTNIDFYLLDGNLPTVHWEDGPFEETYYNITLFDNNRTTVVCTETRLPKNTTVHSFDSCPLREGQAYWVLIEAVKEEQKEISGAYQKAVDFKQYGFNFLYAPTLSMLDTAVNEGVGTGSVSVTLSAPSDWPIKFDWFTESGSAVSSGVFKDYDTTSGTDVIIPKGVKTVNINVPIFDDPRDEDPQSLKVHVTNTENIKVLNSTLEASITIEDNDLPPNLELTTASVEEGKKVDKLKMDLSEVSEKTIRFSYEIVDGTAKAEDGDYKKFTAPISVQLNPGEKSTSFDVETLEDTSVCEVDESIAVEVIDKTNVANGPSNTINILDNDLPSLTLTGDEQDEGKDLVFKATLSEPCPSKTITFDWHTVAITAENGVDFDEQSGTVKFSPKTTTQTFNVTTVDDKTMEVAKEYISVGARNKKNIADTQPSAALGTIRDLQQGAASPQTIKVVTNGFRTVVLGSNGKIKGWGINNSIGGRGPHKGDEPGEMGDNLSTINLGKWDHDKDSSTPEVSRKALSILHSYAETIILADDNKVYELSGVENATSTQLPIKLDLGTWDHDNNTSTAEVDYSVKAIASSPGEVYCAHLADDNVKCWGRSSYGDLGQPGKSRLASYNAEILDFGTHDGLGSTKHKVKELSPPCVILDTDQVKCWGQNDKGQLGLGNTENQGDDVGEMGDNLPYLNLGMGRTAKKVSRSCFILDNGDVKCWGSALVAGQAKGGGSPELKNFGDDFGEFGEGLPPINLGTWDHDKDSSTPRVRHIAKEISASDNHVCVILGNNLPTCWGENFNQIGQLGRGSNSYAYGVNESEMGDDLGSIDIGTGRTAKKVFATNKNTFVIRDDNSLIGFGKNIYGTLGVGHDESIGDEASDLGDNLESVDLGSGVYPVSVNRIDNYRDRGTVCAILNTGALKCWGWVTSSGAAGMYTADMKIGDDPDEMGENLPELKLPTGTYAVDLFGSQQPYKDVYAGFCALLNTGEFVCWGQGHHTNTPVVNKIWDNYSFGDRPKAQGDNFIKHSLGGVTDNIVMMLPRQSTGPSCVLTKQLNLECWGLGIGGTGSSDPSLKVASFSAGSNRKVLSFSGTAHRLCMLLDNYEVKCWGDGSAELGYGDTLARGGTPETSGDSLAPVDLGTVSYPVEVEMGNLGPSCARFANGKVKCWGRGELLGYENTTTLGDNPGEMGDNLSFIKLEQNIKNLTSIGSNYGAGICAKRMDHQTVCWGGNYYYGGRQGLLGTGRSEGTLGDEPGEMSTLTPLDLSDNLGAGTVQQISSKGGGYACALIAYASTPVNNNQVKCWGENTVNQLGLVGGNRGDEPNEMGVDLPKVNIAW